MLLLIFGWLDARFSKNWVCFIVSPRLIFITTIILNRKNTHGLKVVAHSYDLEGKMVLDFFYTSKQTFSFILHCINAIRRVPAYKPGKHWLTSFLLKFLKNVYGPAGYCTMKTSNRFCQECQVKSVPKVNKELGKGKELVVAVVIPHTHCQAQNSAKSSFFL